MCVALFIWNVDPQQWFVQFNIKIQWINCKWGGGFEEMISRMHNFWPYRTEMLLTRQFSTLMFRYYTIRQLCCFHVIRIKFNCLLKDLLTGVLHCRLYSSLAGCSLSWSIASQISLIYPDAQTLEWKEHHPNRLICFLKTNGSLFFIWYLFQFLFGNHNVH